MLIKLPPKEIPWSPPKPPNLLPTNECTQGSLEFQLDVFDVILHGGFGTINCRQLRSTRVIQELHMCWWRLPIGFRTTNDIQGLHKYTLRCVICPSKLPSQVQGSRYWGRITTYVCKMADHSHPQCDAAYYAGLCHKTNKKPRRVVYVALTSCENIPVPALSPSKWIMALLNGPVHTNTWMTRVLLNSPNYLPFLIWQPTPIPAS